MIELSGGRYVMCGCLLIFLGGGVRILEVYCGLFGAEWVFLSSRIF